MSMFLEKINNTTCIRFKIYNNSQKKYEYNGTYNHMAHLNEFNMNDLENLARASLDLIHYETKPFKKHLLTL